MQSIRMYSFNDIKQQQQHLFTVRITQTNQSVDNLDTHVVYILANVSQESH